MDNHTHNMLPAAYALWKNGGVLIPPKGATDVQAIVAKGLVSYPSALTCTDCHQAHVSSEADFFLDQTVRVPRACDSCHQQAGVKPKQ
jgi:predicted CXXCH cytochrome family protein